jgi:hypothetical protein
MPQYAILTDHGPGECPISSRSAREWFRRTYPQINDLAKELDVKFIVPFIHLDPSHKALLLLEAASAEKVRDFIVRAGLMHYLNSEMYLVSPISEIAKELDKIPTVYP